MLSQSCMASAALLIPRGLRAAVLVALGVAPAFAAVADQDDIEARFKRLDANTDGEIAWEEAYQVRGGEFLAMDESLDGQVSETEFGERALPFSSFDADEDGSMSLSEYVGRHRQMFESFDADRSGTINEEEFAEAQAAVRQN